MRVIAILDTILLDPVRLDAQVYLVSEASGGVLPSKDVAIVNIVPEVKCPVFDVQPKSNLR
jgi:hypothetical protein